MVRRFFVFLAVFFWAASFSAAAQNADAVDVYMTETDGVYEVRADNAYIIPVWVYVEFPSLVNMKASVSLPYGGLVPAGTKGVTLFTLEDLPGNGRRGYKMTIRYAKGDPSAVKPDENFLYLFPFEHGAKHRITQGYNGAFTHKGPENQYAIDFDFDMGTPVYAARGGLVFDVKESSNRGGFSSSYNKDTNYVSILHDDGTIGNYAHLKRDGAAVLPGDTATAGQLIGYSGNTGVSSGPHLHFDVQKPSTDGVMRSMPIKFLSHDGSAVDIQEGGYYYAYHPGGPGFPVIFGSTLKHEDFERYSAVLEKTGKIDLRFERVDDTYKVFTQNGTDSAKEITIDFNLRNLVPSRPEPLTVTVPALTEKFLILLRARPKAVRWQYGYSMRSKNAP